MNRLNVTFRIFHKQFSRSTCTGARLAMLLICALSLFLGAPHLARAATTGHISGQLLNGSQNNTPVANQSVTLQMAQGSTSRDLITLKTDAQGNYAFSALQADSSTQYAIYTLYQGAQYVTDLIDLSKNADQQVNLTVYDATDSTSDIAVVQQTILLAQPTAQAGTLTFSEDFFFENLSKKTYVGNLDASKGKPNALLFALPANARNLSLGNSFNGYNSVQVNTGFATNAAIPPGTSEFSFSFQVPYSGTSYTFTYQSIYPTVLLSLFTPLSIGTTPQGLTPKGPSNTQSGTFQKFDVQTLSAGKSVSASFEGLPVPAAAKADSAQSSLNPLMLWLVALLILLMALAGLGGYLYSTRRRKSLRKGQKQSSSGKKVVPAGGKKVAAGTGSKKEALLQELLELDRSYEAGKVKKAAYQEQRSRIKARLREIIQDEPEKIGGAAGKSSDKRGK